MDQISNNERGLGTVRRALALLEWVATRPSPPSVKECSEALGLNLTTCYHLVNTLSDARYLLKDSDRRLSVGPQVAVLYGALARGSQPTRGLLPIVEGLRERTGETCYLSRWDSGEVLMQLVVESPQALRVSGLYVGSRGDAYCRASGKAMLAFLPRKEREAYLTGRDFAPITPNTITDPDQLREDLRLTAERGYSVDQEEFEAGVCCVAVPYFDGTGHMRGALSVSMPKFRAPLMGEQIRPELLRAGEEVSRMLGFTDPYPVVPPAELWERMEGAVAPAPSTGRPT
jgi:IclR family transcriptional regulator, acetate operon repressor